MIKLLIVDDAMFMRNHIKSLVEGYCEVVGEADNGLKGVNLYKEKRPDVVTMDMTMDIMTGKEALLKILEYDPKARVIMCSALGPEYLITESKELGAKGYLQKPFKREDILLELNNILEKE